MLEQIPWGFAMKSLLVSIALFICSTAFSYGDPPVKMSKSGICHAPGSTYYKQTKNFTPYKTLEDCLKAGGRKPKK
jgi:hypothetical protein